MTRPLAVLRPEPGNAATAARIAALGLVAVRMPLFAVVPVAWEMPAGEFDALLLTSANAVRHGGAGLDTVRHLPVVAVGAATATAARRAGFTVEAVGTGDAAAAASLGVGRRLLHLAGRERTAVPGVAAVAVYAADPVAVDPARLAGSVALLHSARAAARLAKLVGMRAEIRIAALSDAVARAAGGGWGRIAVAVVPTDASLVALAADQAR